MEDQVRKDEFTQGDELIKKWDRSQKQISNKGFQRIFRTFMIVLSLAIMVLLTYILISVLIDRMGW